MGQMPNNDLLCTLYFEKVLRDGEYGVAMCYEREAWMPNWPLDRTSFKHILVWEARNLIYTG